MAIGLVMMFEGVEKADYESVMSKDNLDLASPGNTSAADDWPDGIIAHYAGTTPNGWCVVDVWESQAKFDAFMQNRLGPALGKVGLPEPTVTPFELYNSHS